jgi:hypothetical protein
MGWIVYKLLFRRGGSWRHYVGMTWVRASELTDLDAAMRRAGEHQSDAALGAAWLAGYELVGEPRILLGSSARADRRRALQVELFWSVLGRREYAELRGACYCTVATTAPERDELVALERDFPAKDAAGRRALEAFLSGPPSKLPVLARRHILRVCFLCGGAHAPEGHAALQCPSGVFSASPSALEEPPAPVLPAPAKRKRKRVRVRDFAEEEAGRTAQSVQRRKDARRVRNHAEVAEAKERERKRAAAERERKAAWRKRTGSN